ncbi:DUF1700 domain-containing protein [Mycoplasmatota bacterium WC44]
MNKGKFLEKLEEYLYDYDVNRKVVNDILSDHESIIDEAVENGRNEEEFIARLGNPKAIASNLKSEIKSEFNYEYRAVAISPFIATVIFMLLGFIWDLWHPGWLVFLMIPILGVVTSTKLKPITLLTALSPFITTLIFFTYASITDVWHPTWIVFLFIPLIGILNDENSIKRNVMFLLILLSITGYLLLVGSEYDHYAWLLFMVPVLYGIPAGYIEVGGTGDNDPNEKIMKWTVFTTTIGYFVLGIIFDIWHPTWLIFLLIPIIAILVYNGKDNDQKDLDL